jgi:hypothetical protein
MSQRQKYQPHLFDKIFNNPISAADVKNVAFDKTARFPQ